jgi:hypothetical protein
MSGLLEQGMHFFWKSPNAILTQTGLRIQTDVVLVQKYKLSASASGKEMWALIIATESGVLTQKNAFAHVELRQFQIQKSA